ncbi:MAG: 4Fe-4S dicluster domain-containing protein [Thermodesulfobacteriota bacterium]
MEIDSEKCTGCGRCLVYCPVEAISMKNREKPVVIQGKERTKVSVIDLDACAECGVCLRSARCPAGAIFQQELRYPRTIRSLMSDVLTIAEESQISGRGTEEMKTNEVTGRFKRGMVGVAIEVGRPITGTRLFDVEKIAMAVSALDVEFEPCNPVTSMMADAKRGKFKDELLNEKVLSAIVEFGIKTEQLPDLFNILEKSSREIDSVFSLDIACRLDPDGSNPTAPYIEASGLWVAPNGKTNVGLGRPLAE